MPDLMKIGGVTGWLKAMGLAEAASLPLSSHILPEASAHVLAVSPTATTRSSACCSTKEHPRSPNRRTAGPLSARCPR